VGEKFSKGKLTIQDGKEIQSYDWIIQNKYYTANVSLFVGEITDILGSIFDFGFGISVSESYRNIWDSGSFL
jgi:hypothetical protein